MGEARVARYRRRRLEGRRDHRTVIRHSDEEWARVQALAQVHGVSVPRLYERSLHAGDVVAAARLSRLVTEMIVVARVMGKTAVNLNQLARVANATGEVEARQVLAAAHHFDRQVEAVKALLEQVTHADLFVDADSADGADAEIAVSGHEPDPALDPVLDPGTPVRDDAGEV